MTFQLLQCDECQHKVIVQTKTEEERSRAMRRRDAKYLQKLAKQLGAEILTRIEDADKCPKCGASNIEGRRQLGHVQAGGRTPMDEIKKGIEELLETDPHKN